MPETKIWICPHCHGWTANHIPVQGNFELCKTCMGDGVLVNYNERILFWDDSKFIDLRPKLLKLETYAKINWRKYLVPIILLAILIVALSVYFINKNSITGFF